MIKISFLGDISLNDDYIDYWKANTNPFEVLQPILFKSDYVIGNLECIAKGDDGENQLKKPRLTTTIETLNYLKYINLKIATLAHNHIYDHLESGFKKTTDFLFKNSIQFVGASLVEAEANKYLIINKNDVNIGIFNYVTLDTNPNLPKNAKVYLNYFDLDKAKSDIEKIKNKVNHVVIIMHWGGRVEGGLYPDWNQPKVARKLIDIGADLIIGHHSHTIQPYEIYENKLIVYSLGNFCFSDYHFEGNMFPLSRRRKITAILHVHFNKSNYTFYFNFFENKGEFYNSLKNYHRTMKLKNITYKFIFISKLIWNFYFLHKTYILPLILFMQRNDLSSYQKIRRIILSIRRRIN